MRGVQYMDDLRNQLGLSLVRVDCPKLSDNMLLIDTKIAVHLYCGMEFNFSAVTVSAHQIVLTWWALP
jgi:hypothetical protein